MKGNQGLEALAALCGGQSTEAPNGNATETRRDTVMGSSTGSHNSNHSGSHQSPSTQESNQILGAIPIQQSQLQNLTPQQWQHALAALQNNNGVNQSALAQSLLLSGLGGQAVQQFAYQHLAQAQAQAQANISAAQQAAIAQSVGSYGDASHQALLMALTGKIQQLQQSNDSGNISNSQQKVIPTASSNETSTPGSVGSPSVHSMKPPPPPSTQSKPRSMSTTSILSQTRGGHQRIAPMPCYSDEGTEAAFVSIDEKKQQKRAANRKSAQLSRKRKKQFIEELKDENDELRRKEMILRSIPDLIVVFDSSGKLAFVSESVSRILHIPAEMLEGTSFWERMCHDSVKRLKAAFMDALAAREPNSDSAPLGSGLWELCLLDKDRNYVLVTLNGVVHFTGDTPECVCCIRPLSQKSIEDLPKERTSTSSKIRSRFVSSSDGSRSSDDSGSTDDQAPSIRVDPNRSVMGSDNSAEDERTRKNRKNPSVSVDSGGEGSESSGSDDGGASS